MRSIRQEFWRLFNIKLLVQPTLGASVPPFWLEQYLYIRYQPFFLFSFFFPWFKTNCESRPMVLKVTFCTGAIKSSNLCWWTWLIISVRICLASTHYKLFKHHHYGCVICGVLMSMLKSAAFVREILAHRAPPHISQNLLFVTQMKMGWGGRWTAASEGNCEDNDHGRMWSAQIIHWVPRSQRSKSLFCKHRQKSLFRLYQIKIF